MCYINILLPIYNGIEFINQSVNSVLNQTFSNWKLIIGVNGHPENSKVFQTAKEFQSDKIIVLDLFQINNKSDALNEMLKYCDCEWIALIDVDDIWEKNKLEEQIEYTKEYDVIGTKCIYFNNSDIIPPLPVGNLFNYDFKRGNPIINSSVLLKKSLCFWDKNCKIEDYKLWLELWKKGCKFYNLDKILVYHRIHLASAFNSKGNNNSVENLLKLF